MSPSLPDAALAMLHMRTSLSSPENMRRGTVGSSCPGSGGSAPIQRVLFCGSDHGVPELFTIGMVLPESPELSTEIDTKISVGLAGVISTDTKWFAPSLTVRPPRTSLWPTRTRRCRRR